MNYLLKFFFLFFFSFTPFMMIISILGQVLFFIFKSTYLFDMMWFSLTVALLYVGGVMVIFLYLNSVSYKFIVQQKIGWWLFLLPTIILFFTFKTNIKMTSFFYLSSVFYSLKEYYFVWFILFLMLMIYLINNILLIVKTPMNLNI